MFQNSGRLNLSAEVTRTMQPLAHVMPLRLDVHRPRHSFEVLACERSDLADEPYTFTLEIFHPAGSVDDHELLFSAAYLHGSELESGIHGNIQSIVRTSTETASSNLAHTVPSRYRIKLGPRLGLMAYRHNQRIFQGMSAEQIIKQILSEHGIDAPGYSWQRKEPCVERDYCSQYCETDLQLLQRLCAEEGMRYSFVHSRNRHVVVFTDEPPEKTADGQAEAPLPKVRRYTPSAVKMSMQRACVVGRVFETAKPDSRGRLHVRFEWSNQGDGARFNDCWIPVDLTLMQGHQPWWGGMEVVVSFRGGDPAKPFISNRLWDPDINPRSHSESEPIPRRVITTRIDTAMFLDDSQQFCVDDQFIVRMAQHNEMHFRVGRSLVTIDSKNLTLSGLRVMLSSIVAAERDNDGKCP